MPQSATLLFIHFIWATWDRAPVIKPEWENRVYACIRDKCLELNCEALAIGGTDNHVHVLVRMHPDITVAILAKAMKGTSSYLVTHEIKPDHSFKWQGGYGALSVSRSHVQQIQKYVARQKEHHARDKLWPTLEIIKSD